MTRRPLRPAERASEREVRVVAAVLVTGSEKAAAHRLGLSHSTVKHHLANARTKVGANDHGAARVDPCPASARARGRGSSGCSASPGSSCTSVAARAALSGTESGYRRRRAILLWARWLDALPDERVRGIPGRSPGYSHRDVEERLLGHRTHDRRREDLGPRPCTRGAGESHTTRGGSAPAVLAWDCYFDVSGTAVVAAAPYRVIGRPLRAQAPVPPRTLTAPSNPLSRR